jgi:hypothetical protein
MMGKAADAARHGGKWEAALAYTITEAQLLAAWWRQCPQYTPPAAAAAAAGGGGAACPTNGCPCVWQQLHSKTLSCFSALKTDTARSSTTGFIHGAQLQLAKGCGTGAALSAWRDHARAEDVLLAATDAAGHPEKVLGRILYYFSHAGNSGAGDKLFVAINGFAMTTAWSGVGAARVLVPIEDPGTGFIVYKLLTDIGIFEAAQIRHHVSFIHRCDALGAAARIASVARSGDGGSCCTISMAAPRKGKGVMHDYAGNPFYLLNYYFRTLVPNELWPGDEL